jgi:circadian clock protein KaiC
MQSIGLNLRPWVTKGLLKIESTRPTLHGLEQHLVHMYDLVKEFKPSVVAVDPISNLTSQGDDAGLKLTLMRLIDFLKTGGTTALFTSLTADAANVALATSEVGVSSLMDSWLLLSNIAFNGERTRTLQVLKSRGMPHSNQVREFLFSDKGVDLVDVYLFGDQVLTGTARLAHEAQVNAASDLRSRDHARRLRDLATRRKALDALIAALNAEAEERVGEVEFAIARETMEAEGAQSRARTIAASRSRVK